MSICQATREYYTSRITEVENHSGGYDKWISMSLHGTLEVKTKRFRKENTIRVTRSGHDDGRPIGNGPSDFEKFLTPFLPVAKHGSIINLRSFPCLLFLYHRVKGGLKIPNCVARPAARTVSYT